MNKSSPSVRRWASCPLLLLWLIVATGCNDQATYQPDKLALVDRQIVPIHRQQIEALLSELFGTPDNPRVPRQLDRVLDIKLLQQAAGPVESHTPGETTGLYRRHCARCHGITGDGRGPAALYQHPYPRDFRAGVFKYKSTIRGARPSEADLQAVLLRGIPGTAMPSFKLLKYAERDALVQYVRYLSIRGQVEQELIEFVAEELDFDPNTGEVGFGVEFSLQSPEIRDLASEIIYSIATGPRSWSYAEHKALFPTPFDPAQLDDPQTVQRIAAGRALFHDAKRANCVKCHGENGGGGVEIPDHDDWNGRRLAFQQATKKLGASFEQTRAQLATAESSKQFADKLAAMKQDLENRRLVAAELLPPVPADPRRLAGGVLHGGTAPADIFRVIHQGVAGTPMPGVGDTLSEEEIVSLVAYVKSLLGASAAQASSEQR